MLIYPLVQLTVNSTHLKNGNPCGVVVITTVQLHSAKSRFWASPNPVCGVSEIYDVENLTTVPTWNKVEGLSSINHFAKTIHRHHHHYHTEKLQACLSMFDLSVDTRHWRVKRTIKMNFTKRNDTARKLSTNYIQTYNIYSASPFWIVFK